LRIVVFPLVKRIAAQTAVFLILFALVFICAGTIHFWQGWLFCLVFWSSSIAMGIYFIEYFIS